MDSPFTRHAASNFAHHPFYGSPRSNGLKATLNSTISLTALALRVGRRQQYVSDRVARRNNGQPYVTRAMGQFTHERPPFHAARRRPRRTGAVQQRRARNANKGALFCLNS